MPASRVTARDDSRDVRNAPPPSATKAIMAVVEVCSVPYEDAYRVLQNCGMDVQAAIERFLNGQEKWSEVTKKRKPSRSHGRSASKPGQRRTTHDRKPSSSSHQTRPSSSSLYSSTVTPTPNPPAWSSSAANSDARRPPPQQTSIRPVPAPNPTSSSLPSQTTAQHVSDGGAQGIPRLTSQWNGQPQTTAWRDAARASTAQAAPSASSSQPASSTNQNQVPITASMPSLIPEGRLPVVAASHSTGSRINYADAVRNRKRSVGDGKTKPPANLPEIPHQETKIFRPAVNSQEASHSTTAPTSSQRVEVPSVPAQAVHPQTRAPHQEGFRPATHQPMAARPKPVQSVVPQSTTSQPIVPQPMARQSIAPKPIAPSSTSEALLEPQRQHQTLLSGEQNHGPESAAQLKPAQPLLVAKNSSKVPEFNATAEVASLGLKVGSMGLSAGNVDWSPKATMQAESGSTNYATSEGPFSSFTSITSEPRKPLPSVPYSGGFGASMKVPTAGVEAAASRGFGVAPGTSAGFEVPSAFGGNSGLDTGGQLYTSAHLDGSSAFGTSSAVGGSSSIGAGSSFIASSGFKPVHGADSSSQELGSKTDVPSRASGQGFMSVQTNRPLLVPNGEHGETFTRGSPAAAPSTYDHGAMLSAAANTFQQELASANPYGMSPYSVPNGSATSFGNREPQAVNGAYVPSQYSSYNDPGTSFFNRAQSASASGVRGGYPPYGRQQTMPSSGAMYATAKAQVNPYEAAAMQYRANGNVNAANGYVPGSEAAYNNYYRAGF